MLLFMLPFVLLTACERDDPVKRCQREFGTQGQSVVDKCVRWAGDNAPMESCFGTVKTELVHQARYPTWDAARHDLFAYIEGYYNRQRLHSTHGYITPSRERQAA
jgi:hypothetical protein